MAHFFPKVQFFIPFCHVFTLFNMLKMPFCYKRIAFAGIVSCSNAMSLISLQNRCYFRFFKPLSAALSAAGTMLIA